MICSNCKRQLHAADIKGYCEIKTATEIRITCDCGTNFYAFVDHTAWNHGDTGQPVDIKTGKIL